MSIRKIIFASGEYYHVYNRGNSKQKIFRDARDYTRFLDLLFICNTHKQFDFHILHKLKSVFDFDRGEPLVAIGAYCLMPNHFHILITKLADNGITKFMQKLTTAYAMYYNQKYKRTGGLFEGKFKAEHLSTDRYLKYIFSYIHLNPIKLIESKWKEGGIKNKKAALSYLRAYQYSSYPDYLGKNRLHVNILHRESFPEYFPTENLFQEEIMTWINYNIK